MEAVHTSKLMRYVAYFMVFWCASVMPAMWTTAYAQGLPDQVPTTSQTQEGVATMSQDQATEDTLINKRAARLLRGASDDTPVRSPNLTEDAAPVRSPRILVNPSEDSEAQQQAAKIPKRSQQEMVSGAQSGSIIGQGVFRKADTDNQTLSTERADPGVNETSTHNVNVSEILPGFTKTEANRQTAMGAAIYADPAKAKVLAEQNKRNLQRNGCRKTTFTMLERQNIDSAQSSAANRILMVEFFDLVKQPIPGTNPVEYQIITQPSTYKRGTVNLSVATLGGSSTVYWDRVDESYAIRYTYTPFTSPKNRNFFTYNHWFAVSHGAGIERVFNPGLVSYGDPKTGWKPVAGYSVPIGVTAVYLSADLYQADATFTEPVEGVPCPPDPPESCEVPSVGGDTIRWCPDAFGANIVLMYDDQLSPSDRKVGKTYNDMLAANASQKDYTNDPAIRSGVIRGLNAPNSSKAQELIGSCNRDTISHIEINLGKPYGNPDINTCSEALINPYPDGCKNIKRSFGLAYVGEQNYVTVKAFTKVKVPIMDPVTGKQVTDTNGNALYTYRKDPANVSGPIRTDFPIMGSSICSNDNCTTERLPDDPLGGSEGYYVEYIHTPMGGDPNTFAFNGIYVQTGGVGNFTNYGKPAQQWLPTGTASGDGTMHEVRLMAKAYSVPINAFAGCEKYMQFVADGYCRGGKLTCVDSSPTRTVGDVTFGPGMPNDGIVDILKKWGTDSSAVISDYDGGDSTDPTPNGPAISLLDDKMCWEAQGESFTSCTTMEDEGSLKQFFKGQELWGSDCGNATDPSGTPLNASTSCKRVPELDTCDTRFQGLYTGECYNPTLAYDCGTTTNSKLPVVVEEQGDTCTGAMRCLGTECHRPNLSGGHGGDFAAAVSGMEAINYMVDEMVCAETGERPKSADETCTPQVFGGKAMYCKIPIGNEIGITPNCCKEAKKAAAGSPSWIQYLQAIHALYKITNDAAFKAFMSNYDVYNSTANAFGEIAKPITDMYQAASKWVTEDVIAPFSAGFDNLYASFGLGGSGAMCTPATLAVDAVDKAPSIMGMIDGFEQMLMAHSYDILLKIGGQQLADMVFVTTETAAANGETVTTYALTNGMSTVLMAFQIYSFVSLIGHIIFACKQEEFEWGTSDKWRLTTYVDTCCAKKVLFVCVEKRQLYCSYKSIAARVISEQIIKKNLIGTRPYGYRTGSSGQKLTKCNINCNGFTPMELAAVDWSKVDLTEWTDALVEGGLLNTADPRTNYGVSQNEVQSTKVIGQTEDTKGDYDQKVPAVKTAAGWVQNSQSITDFAGTLHNDGLVNCYVDDKKMPFTYPGCKTK